MMRCRENLAAKVIERNNNDKYNHECFRQNHKIADATKAQENQRKNSKDLRETGMGDEETKERKKETQNSYALSSRSHTTNRC